MRVYNFHCRRIVGSLDEVGSLIETLASDNDRLWPWEHFDAMRFDGPARVGARGGHGPVRYTIIEHATRRRIVFRFDAEQGLMKRFAGRHWFEVIEIEPGLTELRHMLWADIRGIMRLLWWLVVEPLHDATVEAALAKAELEVTGTLPQRLAFSRRQRFWKNLTGERGAFDRGGNRAKWLA